MYNFNCLKSEILRFSRERRLKPMSRISLILEVNLVTEMLATSNLLFKAYYFFRNQFISDKYKNVFISYNLVAF